VIWHDHFGRCGTEERPAWLYGLAAKKVDGVIAVNDALAEWSRSKLKIPANRIWYVPNFVDVPEARGAVKDLPGMPGLRIVCVANFRPQKDHLNLIRAMGAVVRQIPGAHLLLVAPVAENAHVAAMRSEIAAQSIEANVSFLGARPDVADVLRQCDVGVLASSSEGLPLSLLEYGAVGMASVATNVGQCGEVLNGGEAGLLVPPARSEELAEALMALLASSERRKMFGERFRQRVAEAYSAESAMRQVCRAYDVVLGRESEAREESSAVTVSVN
jgi:glycosyltransferase involved in cell wall biosynthesis